VIAGGPALLAAAVILAGCSSPLPGATTVPPASAPRIQVPLATTFATTTGVGAVIAMGRLGDPLNTFWQLFFRSNATSRWMLVTPPGVADNGGLVVSPSPLTGTSFLAGFEPNQDLVFSPLALSLDGGRSWSSSPGLVPGGLAAVPDALAESPAAGSLALVRAGGGAVLRSTGDLAHWSTLVTRAALASSSAVRSCGVGLLTAVALDATRGVLAGTTCTSPGVVGIVGRAGGTWRLVGPRLTGRSRSAPTKVVRLVSVDGVVSGLVALGTMSGPRLVGVASVAGASWVRSAPLPMDRGSSIVSTGVQPGGGFVVLTLRPNRSLALDVETGPGGGWRALPAPPRGTATVAVGPGSEVDALAVASTRFTQWRLDAAAGTWSKIGTMTVPIQFGSSS